MHYKTFNLVKYNFTKAEILLHTIAYSFVGFFLPFFLAHPQWLVGTVVNAVLIFSALNIRRYSLLPVIIMPSLGVLSRGLIFGPFTIFLVYFIPFIWAGNALLVFLFKYLNINKKLNYFATLTISACAKAAFLFTAAFVLYKLGIIPVMFLTAMGLMQLITAISGGIIAFGAVKARKIF